MNASLEELVAVDEIGERIAQSVVDFRNDLGNIQLIDRLKSYGIQLEISEELIEGQTEKLKGSTFVVSGVFEKVSRNELKALIEKNGGKVSGSISKKTTFVVAGDKMGPSKRLKAENLGVQIITENEFLTMLV